MAIKIATEKELGPLNKPMVEKFGCYQIDHEGGTSIGCGGSSDSVLIG